MFDQSIQRIGFCCKYLEADQTLPKKVLEEAQRPFNTRSTTITWLNRQDKDVAEQRLWDLMVHNIQSYYKLIEYTGSLIPQRRMVRLGSDCLPAFTQENWSYFWQKPDVQEYCEKEFAKVGDLARQLDGNRLDPAVERDDRLDHVGAVVIFSAIGRGFRRYGDHFKAD